MSIYSPFAFSPRSGFRTRLVFAAQGVTALVQRICGSPEGAASSSDLRVVSHRRCNTVSRPRYEYRYRLVSFAR